jgi:geranylgeranyl diphosphate synthase type II
VFGEAIATLAGDALLTDAFKVLARCSLSADVRGSALIETVAELAEAAGSAGMVGGQVIDLLAEGRDLTLSELEVLHGKKTGALFVASVCGGARLGGANETRVTALREYARKLGLAFQVADDLLDVEASAEQLGKRTQKDAARGKATFPALIGIERSRAMARDLAANALRAIANFDGRAEPLRALASYAVERRL